MPLSGSGSGRRSKISLSFERGPSRALPKPPQRELPQTPSSPMISPHSSLTMDGNFFEEARSKSFGHGHKKAPSILPNEWLMSPQGKQQFHRRTKSVNTDSAAASAPNQPRLHGSETSASWQAKPKASTPRSQSTTSEAGLARRQHHHHANTDTIEDLHGGGGIAGHNQSPNPPSTPGNVSTMMMLQQQNAPLASDDSSSPTRHDDAVATAATTATAAATNRLHKRSIEDALSDHSAMTNSLGLAGRLARHRSDQDMPKISDEVSEQDNINASTLRRERQLLQALRDADDRHHLGAGDDEHAALHDDDLEDVDAVISGLVELGELYDDLGNFERRRDVLLRLLPLLERRLATSEHTELAYNLAELGRAHHELGSDADACICVERALHIYEGTPEDEPSFDADADERVAAALALLARIYARLGRVVDQRDVAERAVQVLERMRTHASHSGTTEEDVESDDALADALSICSDAYARLGLHSKQRDACLRELRLKSSSSHRSSIELVPVLRALATAYKALGDFEKEKSALRQAFNIQEHDPTESSDSPRLIFTLTMLARTYSELEEFEAALHTLERVLSIKRKRYGPSTSTVLETLWELAGACDDLERYEDELVHLKHALTVSEQLYGGSDRRVAFVVAQLAVCRAQAGETDAATLKNAYERALGVLEAIYGVGHVVFAMALKQFGRASGLLGDFPKQRKILRKALEIEQRLLPVGDERIASTMVELGNCMGKLGYLTKQRELLEMALDSFTHSNAPLYKRTALLGELAACYSELKEIALARDALLRVQKLEEREYGSEHVLVGLTCKMLTDVYITLGDIENAHASCKRAQGILRGTLHKESRVLLELDRHAKRLRYMQKGQR